jgi:hypothetical protein
MGEREWLACTDLGRMLEELQNKASERKFRLLAVACCRGIWHLLTDERSRAAVELAEKTADGVGADEDYAEAANAVRAAFREALTPACRDAHAPRTAGCAAARAAVRTLTEEEAIFAAGRAAFNSADAAARESAGEGHGFLAIRSRTYMSHLTILRDIFGNPFRPVVLDSTSRTPDVLAMAQAAYDNRTLPAGTLETERLTVLADALEEAGCADADILGHLRGPGPHYRGCWVIDILLEKS